MEERISIYEKLSNIQNEMNVPKNLYNKFGKYYYRNAETILETAKPICKKYRATLTVEDRIHVAGERYYVESIAKLMDWDSCDSVINIAYAREEENKKGMDASQVTGSCSSYARKYALNGLFNLDDNKDADTDEFVQQTTEEQNEQPKQVKKAEVDEDKFFNLMTELKTLQTKLDELGIDWREKYKDAFLTASKLTTQDVGEIKIKDYKKALVLKTKYEQSIKKAGGK